MFFVPKFNRQKQYIFCNLNYELNEKDSRNVIFKVMINSKILERLDVSNEF